MFGFDEGRGGEKRKEDNSSKKRTREKKRKRFQTAMRRMKIGHCTPRTALTLLRWTLFGCYVSFKATTTTTRSTSSWPRVGDQHHHHPGHHLEPHVFPERGVIVWNRCSTVDGPRRGFTHHRPPVAESWGKKYLWGHFFFPQFAAVLAC